MEINRHGSWSRPCQCPPGWKLNSFNFFHGICQIYRKVTECKSVVNLAANWSKPTPPLFCHFSRGSWPLLLGGGEPLQPQPLHGNLCTCSFPCRCLLQCQWTCPGRVGVHFRVIVRDRDIVIVRDCVHDLVRCGVQAVAESRVGSNPLIFKKGTNGIIENPKTFFFGGGRVERVEARAVVSNCVEQTVLIL